MSLVRIPRACDASGSEKTYRVLVRGNTYHSSYGYVTINGTKYTANTELYFPQKPTVSVYVGSATSSLRSSCQVRKNGVVVKSGYGTYTLSFERSCTININSTSDGNYQYYWSADLFA